MTMETETERPERVTVSLPADAMTFLRQESQRTGRSMADVLRQSIANEKYLREVTAKGADLILAEPGKQQSRLVFR